MRCIVRRGDGTDGEQHVLCFAVVGKLTHRRAAEWEKDGGLVVVEQARGLTHLIKGADGSEEDDCSGCVE